MSKLPRNILSLERFMLRTEVLKLYRKILRTIRQIPNPEYRKEMQKFARHDFDANKHLEDADAIRMMLTRGKQSLKELESSVNLSK